MKTPLRSVAKTSHILAIALLSLFAQGLHPQTPSQQLVFAGLRSVASQGQFNGVKTDASGNIYLLLDQGDGVRILKTDPAGNALLAQAQLGAKGDSGVALALDPVGNVYVAGTTTSSVLTGTSGSALPNRTDTSTNSFVARFDAALNPIFVTFTGGSRIAATAIAATADAVFVTGITYAANLPVTIDGIQQAPAYASTQNGFVERFSANGATLVYVTYLTGANGDTTPAAIAADSSDAAYVVGETSATGFPTIAALVPESLSNPSGFLTKLRPLGDAITFSTFVPGAGLTSIALDSTGQTLLISGSVALGQFPVDTVATPLTPTNYQVLLRIPTNGSSVLSSTVLAPANQSFVAAGPNGSAWVDGVLTAPLLPATALATLGGGFAVHIPASSAVDQAVRFGGLANQSPTYASLPATVTSVAVDASGQLLFAGSMLPTASSSLLATETYDLPLRGPPTAALPSTIRSAAISTATCIGSLCSGSAAYLAKIDPATAGPALAFSLDDVPFVILRNLGSADANGIQLSAVGATLATNCPPTLYAGSECNILLSGGAAGTLTASANNATPQTVDFPAYPATTPANTIAFSPKELDFGIQTSTSPAATRTLTVTNLGTTSHTFASIMDAVVNPKQPVVFPFTEVASDCTLAGSITLKSLAPGGTCHITLGLTASPLASSDGFLNANWSIGGRDVLLTGYSQSASLSVSATEIDFGTQFANGIHLPRYLYLSNASAVSVSHAALSLPSGSPFTISDACSTLLPARSVCRIRIDYFSAKSTSTDSASLALDSGLSVILTGKTLPPKAVIGTTANPNLSVTPVSVSFSNPVPVTAVSSNTQTVTVANTGASAFSLTIALSGDFTDTTDCAGVLGGGHSCSVVLTFAPAQPGTRQSLLAVTAGTGTSPIYVPLSGTATSILPATNGTLDSGSTPVGQPITKFYKVAQPFTTLAVVATGPYKVILVEDAGFGPGSPPLTTYASSFSGTCRNCWLGVEFVPTGAGSQPGTLSIASTPAGSPYLLNLIGTGLPTNGLILTPAASDFGTIPVHSTSGSQTLTLTNLNATPAVLSGPATTGDYVVTGASTGGADCTGKLASGASCLISIAFSPSATGSRIGTLSIGGANASAVLTGNGSPDPGIAINPLALSFDNVPGATATAQTISVTNTSSSSLQIGIPTHTTSSFGILSTCGTLTAGATCSLTVTYAPGNATVADTISLPVTTTAGAPQETTYFVALSGNYTATSAGLQIVPGTAQYGAYAVGQTAPPRSFTINNLTAKSVALSVAIPRQFAVAGAPCTALAPFASCDFSLAFSPLTNGDQAGTLSAIGIPSDGSPALHGIGYAEGYGLGSGVLTVSGALIVSGVFNFGQVASGQTSSQTFTFANLNPAGSPPITVRRVTSGPPFLSSTTCGTAISTGQTCTVTVTYAPSNQVAVGTVSPAVSVDAGQLTIESDAATSPDTINLTGRGSPLSVANPSNAAPLATFTLSQGSLTLPQTAVGDISNPQSITLTNTGSSALHIASAYSTADYSVQHTCSSVVAGGSCTLTVSATPQTPGVHLASLEVASDSAVSLEFVSLVSTGAPASLTFSPAALSFGPVLVGSSATLPLQVTNVSSTPVVFSSTRTTSNYFAAGSCPSSGGSLAANSSCTLVVIFAPAAPGALAGALTVTSSASTNPLSVPLSGVGTISQLALNPGSLAFAATALGSTSSLPLTLNNTGTVPITNLSLTTNGDYTVTTPCLQTSLSPGASCTVQIAFTPTALGSRPSTLTVASSDPGSPATVPLAGIGVAPPSFTFTVKGASSATVSVVSGQPAAYQLLLTPAGGFSSPVALTCAPVIAAQFAACSLLPSSLVASSSAQTSVATINTITSGAHAALEAPSNAIQAAFWCLLFPGLLTVWKGRNQLRKRRILLLALLFSASAIFTLGCASGGQFNTLYTPLGTYQYQVTASSTSGPAITQTVTLNLIVTGR